MSLELPHSSPVLGEPEKEGWRRVAENLRAIEAEAQEDGVKAAVAQLAGRAEALHGACYPCDRAILEKRKKQARLARELAEVS